MNAQQVIIHTVPGRGSLIIYRYGLVFRVFLDGKDSLEEKSPEWIQRHYVELRRASSAASRTLFGCGLGVEVYAS